MAPPIAVAPGKSGWRRRGVPVLVGGAHRGHERLHVPDVLGLRFRTGELRAQVAPVLDNG